MYSKLAKAGFSGAAVTWFRSYLSERTRVTRVNDAISSAKSVPVGVPQGSVLGPLLLIYVSGLPSYVTICSVPMYADDTVLYFSSTILRDLEHSLNIDLDVLCKYFNDNLLTLNVEKCKFVLFGSPHKVNLFSDLSLEINAQILERKECLKYLGIKLNQNMSWSDHIDTLCKKVCHRLGVLRRVKYLLPLHGCLTQYNSLILLLFDYADTVWGDKNNEVLMHNLQVLQNNAERIILDLPKYFSGIQDRARLNSIHLAERQRQHRCTAVYKCVNKCMKSCTKHGNSFPQYTATTRLASPSSTYQLGKATFFLPCSQRLEQS